MTRRFRLIFNSHAARGRAWETGSLLRSIAQRHPEAEWAATEHPSHATELAAEKRQLVAAIALPGADRKALRLPSSGGLPPSFGPATSSH